MGCPTIIISWALLSRGCHGPEWKKVEVMEGVGAIYFMEEECTI